MRRTGMALRWLPLGLCGQGGGEEQLKQQKLTHPKIAEADLPFLLPRERMYASAYERLSSERMAEEAVAAKREGAGAGHLP